MPVDIDTVQTWRGREVVDEQDEKIGKVDEIYVDDQTDQPEWALLSTGLFGGKGTFVPITGAVEAGGQIRVPFAKRQIKDAPSFGGERELSQEEERRLYRHYGIEYSERASDSGLPAGGAPQQPEGATGHDVSGPTTDSAMTRSEEEVTVDKTRREAGRVRLRKHVVTEDVNVTVPVQREEVRLEREPITDANVEQAATGPDISEEEHEVVLHQEEVVVGKQAVPKERVRLDKETVVEQRQVGERVRKEQIEVDPDADPGSAA